MTEKDLRYTEFSQAAVEPGFYQSAPQHGAVGGERLRGRKSGRVAPRDHVRQPAWEDTLQRHDLLPMNDNQVGSNRDYDPNQGQLFDTQSVTPRDTRSDVEIAKSRGAVTGEITAASTKKQDPLLGATPGFMPGLDKKQKIEAIKNMESARVATGADRGSGHWKALGRDKPWEGSTSNAAPFKEMMEDRAAAFAKGSESKAPWYMGTDETGHFRRDIQGDAARKIQESAARVGAGSSEHIRTTAMTSPQMAWKSEGSTRDPMTTVADRGAATAGMYPNIAVAEQVAGGVRGAKPWDGESTYEREGVERSIPRQVHHPDALGGTPDGRAKAAGHVARAASRDVPQSEPYPIQDIKNQKAPNFEASLNLSHIDPAIQRIAAQSFTIDRHDASGVGIDAESKEFKRRGSYEAVAMTGRRAALKNRELPPNEQAIEWEARREDKGLGKGNQMFVAGTGLGNGTPVVRPELIDNPAGVKPPTSRGMRRGRRYDPASDPDGPGF